MAALAATAICVGCGIGTPSPEDIDSRGPATDTARGERIDARVVYFDNDERHPYLVRTVIRTEEERVRFPGWFAASPPAVRRAVSRAMDGVDLKANVLVAHVGSTGCGRAESAQLIAEGSRLSVRLVGMPPPPPECHAPHEALAVFSVPRARMPERPLFSGPRTAPDPAGPGELLAFTEVGTVRPPKAPKQAEITAARQRDRFLESFPEPTAAAVRKELPAAQSADTTAPDSGIDEPRQRLFAFQLTGCRLTGATLHAETGILTASPVGGTNVRCIRPEHFLAVFAVPSAVVPDPPLPSVQH